MLTYVQINGTFEDGSGTPLTGFATFTPSSTVYAAGAPVMQPDMPVSAQIVAGSLQSASGGPLKLLATDNSGITVEGTTGFWFWSVKVTIGSQVQPEWSFFLPSTTAVDLYALANTAAGGGGAGFANPMTATGDMINGGSGGAAARLAGNTSTTRKFARSVGDGTSATAPAWDTLQLGDMPSGVARLAGSTFTGYLAPAVVNLTFGTTIAVNAALGNVFAVTLTSSAGTLANPTNPVDGQTIRVRVLQDATGGRTLAYDTAYSFGAGGAPTLSTTPNKMDVLSFQYVALLSKWVMIAAPPNGTAGGDLSGTYPNPGVAKVNGVTVSGTPSAGQVLTATSPTAAAFAPPSGVYQAWQFQPETFGAAGDGKIVSDGAMTSGSATLTCATSTPFTSGDAGKVITVEGAGATLTGTSVASALSTTISAYVSPSQVTLAVNASATVSGRTVTFGTNDTTAINSAISAAAAYAAANDYYAEVIFRPRVYMIAGPLIQGGASKTNSQIPLPVVPVTGNPTMTLALIGTRNNSGPEMFQGSGDTPAAAAEGTVLASTLTGQVFNGTFGPPAVIGGPTFEQGYTGGFTNLWNNLMVVVDGLTVLVPPITSLSGIDLTSCIKAEVIWARSMAAAPANVLSGAGYNPVWAGGQSFPKGLVMPQGGNNVHCVIGSFAAYGFATGVEAYEHTTFTELATILCGIGMYVNAQVAGHGVTGLKWSAEANNTHLKVGNESASVSVNVVSMQCENNAQFAGGFYIDDGSSTGYGRIGLETSQGTGSVFVNGCTNLELILDKPQPRGVVGPPAMPASAALSWNPYWRHATVYITSGGAAVGPIKVNGTTTGLTLGTTGTVTIRVPSGQNVALTYASTAPTWVWVLE